MPTNQGRLFPTPAKRSRGRTRKGLDDTLLAMRRVGRLDDVDAALVALCRVAADELDAAVADKDESRYTRGTLTARYHDVLSHLLQRPTIGAEDSLDDILAALAADA